MRQSGSVLIVVLGLLAILAVVGIAFVTMSGIERNSAANFAIQSQFDLAADSAVDYVCHHLVWDLWDWDPTKRTSAGMLLNNTLNTVSDPLGSDPNLYSNEPYDCPGVLDPWLASTLTSASLPPGFHYSYDAPAPTPKPYGLTFWGRDCVNLHNSSSDPDGPPDNLGFPTSNPPGNGLWIPELTFPYDRGLIRISLTVQDHNALINLNAHGNGVSGWPYADATGKGYFISDVSPSGISLSALLLGSAGVWGPDLVPGNTYAGAALIENPSSQTLAPLGAINFADYPLTLDEEFALRKLSGTLGSWTRLYQVGLPDSSRMLYTCVGWTSEVRGDGNAPPPDHRLVTADDITNRPGDSRDWSRHKFDLNGIVSIDNVDRTAEWFLRALTDGRVMPTSSRAKQLAVNILAFRDRTASFKPISYDPLGGPPYYVGARRQPLFTKVSAKKTKIGADGAPDEWTVTVKVYNPWTGDYANSTSIPAKIITIGQKVVWDVNTHSPIPPFSATDPSANVGSSILANSSPPRKPGITNYVLKPSITAPIPIIVPSGKTLSQELTEIRLEVTVSGQTIVLDRIENAEIDKIDDGGKDVETFLYRPIWVEEEWRGSDQTNQEPITVLYINDWKPTDKKFDKTEEDGTATQTIPIRFPHSVDKTIPPPLPPRSKTGPFLAFLRVGDLNQVLCPKEGDTEPFWPWVPRVAKASANPGDPTQGEAALKFDWADESPYYDTGYHRSNAANVLAVVCPWSDGIDNDGDGRTDSDTSCSNPDQGSYDLAKIENLGRFGGPELRVAGKINLNTATDETLTALAGGVGVGTLTSAVKTLRAAGPIKSVALLLQDTSFRNSASDPAVKGWVEKRNLAFTRISNIATIRSDTFSIYGTVQYIEPNPSGSSRLIKSRRFWALVDRSPCLAYNPTGSKFIRPRILNFQWLN